MQVIAAHLKHKENIQHDMSRQTDGDLLALTSQNKQG